MGPKVHTHLTGGLAVMPQSAAEYDGWFDGLRQKVPKERQFSWNMKKHRYEDLCALLEIEPCPRSGLLETYPNVYDSWWWDKFGDCSEAWKFFPIYFFIHWINFKIYGAVLSLPLLLVGGKNPFRRIPTRMLMFVLPLPVAVLYQIF